MLRLASWSTPVSKATMTLASIVRLLNCLSNALNSRAVTLLQTKTVPDAAVAVPRAGVGAGVGVVGGASNGVIFRCYLLIVAVGKLRLASLFRCLAYAVLSTRF
ncbi:hypothetical protein F4679DRAFT_347411 [Xylaria curta]|nr:hypothetical protein F4679DRAFT_347411 [Xylaria curta]